MSHLTNRFVLTTAAALALSVGGSAWTGLALAPAAQAAATVPSGCEQAASTITCGYAPTGGEQHFAVPAGVTELHVVASGGRGGDSTYLGRRITGGLGALVSATLPVSAGQDLYVEVGGAGDGAAGGFNGGGAGSENGQGGGGASDVRTCPIAGCPDGGPTLDSRVLVAGGGGGAGGYGDGPGGPGGAAGASAQPGGAGDDVTNTLGGGGGGGGASTTSGGVGGIGPAPAGLGAWGISGAPGVQGTGGAGAADAQGGEGQAGATGGGGGGGGWFGGGGAASGSDHYLFAPKGFRAIPGPGGGGGAGSSYLEPVAENASITTEASGQAPAVTITYTVPAPALPSAPSIGSVVPGDGSATIDFSAPPSDGDSPITQYAATATPIDGGNPVTGTSTGTAERFTLEGLTNRTTYTVTVAAINSVGTGAASGSSDPFVPLAPLRITTPSALPTFPINKVISMVLNASGGTEARTWSMVPGSSLPAGLTLGTDGTIYGTPTTAVTNQRFSVRVADVAPEGLVAIEQMSMTINPAAAPDLRAVLTHSGRFVTGRSGSYTMKIANSGTAATSDTITATLALPSGMVPVSASGSGWRCRTSGRTETCTRSTKIYPIGASTIHLTVHIAAAVGKQLTATARVTPTDSKPTNNLSTTTVTIVRP